MKHKPDNKKPLFGAPPEKSTLLNKSERNRMIFMGVLLLGLTVAFGASLLTKSKYEREQDNSLAQGVPVAEEPDEVIAVRRFDPATIAGDVRDGTPEERVLIDLGPLAKMLDHVAGYGPGQWKGLAPEHLDAARYETLLADPSAHRAAPLWLRGRLTSYEERPVGDRIAWYGTLESEEGVPVTFMTSSFDKGLFGAVEEDLTYAKLEGLFLEVYRLEGEDGWIETPLLVGSRLEKSYPRIDGFDDETYQSLVAAIQDDTNNNPAGIDDVAFLAQWMLMDRIDQGWGETIDWSDPEVAPVINNEVFNWLLANPDKARGKPFVLSPSKNLGSRTQDAGENPARIDSVTTGWIGSVLWTNKGSVMKYIMPGSHPEITAGGRDQLITGRGFFLKHYSYEPSGVERRVVPLLVFESIEVFTPVENTNVATIFYFVGALTILLLLLIPYLVIRDRKQSEKLREELVRRKQERRRRAAGAGTAGA
jgi:hypothetical protein